MLHGIAEIGSGTFSHATFWKDAPVVTSGERSRENGDNRSNNNDTHRRPVNSSDDSAVVR